MLPSRFTYPSPGFSHYWHNGGGINMLAKLEQVPDKKAIEASGHLLLESDILADKIIKEVFEKVGHHKAHELLNNLLGDSTNAKDVPESLQQLFTEINTPPEWLDYDLLNAGSSFCRRTDAFGLSVLRNYCLMGGYESSAINKPLIFTEALKKGAAKRMAETIEFWVNVTREDAMSRNSLGFRSTIKVRIMHAFARISIQRMPNWSNDAWGIPINQGDMIATNLGFSLVFMEGLKRVGFRPTEKEIQGVFHLWKYIGYLLGIPPSYLPDTEKQAIASLYKWTMSQSAADKDTKALAFALMNEPILASFPKYSWQKKLLIKVHLGYNYYFLGDRACKTMELPTTLFRYLPYLAAVYNRFRESFTLNKKSWYNASVLSGQKNQEKIKMLFLKGHASTLIQPQKHSGH